MNLVLQTPSLEHLAGVKIVAHLWTRRCDGIRQSFKSLIEYLNQKYYYLNGNGTEWKGYEEQVESKVCALPLPQLLKQPLLNLVKPIGKEIVAWHHYHSKRCPNFHCLDILLGSHLRWTMRGTLDYTKTAEFLVKDERVDVQRRYKIACVNCLEDEARHLIEFIPESIRRHFMNKRNYLDELDHHFLISYFTHTLTGKENLVIRYLGLLPDESINTFLFTETLASGNRATCQYFFAKLNQREKDKVLNDCETQRLNRPCASLYYLSLLNEQQQERLFRERTLDLLIGFLRWPMQSLFMEAHLFWKMWRLTSAENKRALLENFAFVDSLLRTKREEFIQLILNEAPARVISQLCTRFDYNSWEAFMFENVINSDVAFMFENVINSDAAFMDENVVICEAALMECKETAALNSSNEPQDEAKRLRSEQVTRFVDIVMTRRIKS